MTNKHRMVNYKTSQSINFNTNITAISKSILHKNINLKDILCKNNI